MHPLMPNVIATVIAALAIGPSVAHAADPTNADCLAASEASLKAGNAHHLRAERSELLVCSSSNCPSDIRKECLHRVDEVNAAIPTVIFQAKDGVGNDLVAVRVTLDGEVLAERLEGTPLSIDPGEHTFVFETPGQPSVQKHFVIQEGQKDQRESIAFGTPILAPPQAGPPQGSAFAPGTPSSSTPDNGEGLSTPKIVAIVAGGVGVVGLGVGSAFGLVAISKKSDAQNACPGECADQAGVGKWRDAKSAAQVSDVAFVVGAVGLGAAAVLWFVVKSPPASEATAQVGFGLGSVELKGAW